MSKVSIIMPVYNAGKYIDEAIQSILGQSFTDWELIIVSEPNNQDNTIEIIEEYKKNDSRIVLIVNQEQLGISKSLNVGLAAAMGEFILRMDADDISLPERIEKQVKYMEMNPEIGISGTDYYVQGEDWKSNLITASDQIVSDLLFFVPLRHPTIIMRKSLLDRYSLTYDNNVLAAEDYDLFFRASQVFKLSNLDEKLVIYRRHADATVYRMLDEGYKVNKYIGTRLLDGIGIHLDEKDMDILYRHCLLSNDGEPYNISNIIRLEDILVDIWKNNKESCIYDKTALFKTLLKRWKKEVGIAKKAIKDTKALQSILENSVFDFDWSEEKPIYKTLINFVFFADNESASTIKTLKSLIAQEEIEKTITIVGLNNERLLDRIDLIMDFIPRIMLLEKEAPVDNNVNRENKNEIEYYSFVFDGDYLFRDFSRIGIERIVREKADAILCSSRNNQKFTSEIRKEFTLQMLLENRTKSFGEILSKEVFLRICYDGAISKKDLLARVIEQSDYCIITQEHLENNNDNTVINLEKSFVDNEYKKYFNIRLSKKQKDLLTRVFDENDRISDSAYENNKFNIELEKFFKRLLKSNDKYKYFNENLLLKKLSDIYQNLTGNRFNNVNLRFHNKILIKWNNFRYNHSRYMHYDNMLNRYLSTVEKTKDNEEKNIDEIIKRWTWDRYRRNEADCNKLADKIKYWTWDRYKRSQADSIKLSDGINNSEKNICRKIDQKIWDAERRIIVLDDLLVEQAFISNKVRYHKGEIIRIAIIFQVASFWPSIASLYNKMVKDNRFDVKVICYDEDYDRTIKTETAKDFLEANNIPYENWLEFSLKEYRPHIVFLQTPYDGNRRKEYKSNYLKMQGYRVVYVPYGMEIGDTDHSRKQQLDHIVRRYAWMIFTFSNIMKRDYRLYSEYFDNVYVTGLPKFDSLYNRYEHPLKDEIIKKANGKRIILWKVHFPKVANVNGKMELFTPNIDEYLDFTEYVRKDETNFYIFMPHPRFMEFNEDATIQRQLHELMYRVSELSNVYIDSDDDYRSSLLNVDAIIVDRSSIMVEAGCVGVPVLFMYNDKFKEPMTKAIQPLIDSYYQGSTANDLISFVEMINQDEDPKKEEREEQFKNCIPYFDGNCSRRIIDCIVNALATEDTDGNRLRYLK